MARAITSKTVLRTSLSESDRAKMFRLMAFCYDNVDQGRFDADLDDKSHVILLRATNDKSIVGFSTLRVDEECIDGTPALVIFSGDTVVHPDHWGAKALQQAFLRFALVVRLGHPTKRLFWLLISKGYKTYLLVTRYAPNAVPRRGFEPPDSLTRFMHDIASARWPQAYNAEKGILDFAGELDCVKPGLAPIDDEARKDPDVAFFEKKNPGHVKGEELVCFVEGSYLTFVVAFFRVASSVVRRTGRARRRSKVKKDKVSMAEARS